MATRMTDMEDIPDEIRSVVAQFDSTLGDIEEHLRPILASDARAVVKNLDPMERAKLQLAMAYAVNSLFFMYLRTQGIDARNHPVRGGLERVQHYMSKIKAAQRVAEKQRLKLDKEAARRFVLHSLPADAVIAKAAQAPDDDGAEDGDSVMQGTADDDTQQQDAASLRSEESGKSRAKKKKQTPEEGSEPPKKKKHKKKHVSLDARVPEQNQQ